MRKFFLKIFSVIVALVVFSCVCFSVSAETKPYTVRMPFSEPQLTENSGYIEILVSSGDADTGYVSAVVIGWDICNSFNDNSNFVQVKYDNSKGRFELYPNDSHTGTFNYYLLRSDGTQSYYSDLIIDNYYTWFEVDNVLNFKVYGNFSNVSGVISSTAYPFSFTYSDGIDEFYNMRTVINLLTSQGYTITDMHALLQTVREYSIYAVSNLEAIRASLEAGNQAIIDNQNQNASQIQQNQDKNTDKVLNGDEDLDVSDKTGAVDGSVGDMESATDNALGGKSDEEIQEEISSALDSDNVMIDYKKAGKISAFFDGLLNCFGSDYKSVLVLSLSLGLGAFLIGRRYA